MSLAEIISICLSCISLIAVIYQGIILRKTIANQIYESCISYSLEFDRTLIENPELRKYVYGNEPVDDKTENLDKIMSLMEFAVDIMENIEVHKKYIPKSRRKGWIKYINDIKNTNAYKFYMKKCGSWFEVE